MQTKKNQSPEKLINFSEGEKREKKTSKKNTKTRVEKDKN